MAIITVTSIADSGSGSVRDAIAKAQPGDTIAFSPSLANQTITLSSELEIPAGKNLTIDGSAAPNLTISGNDSTRIMHVDSNQDFPTSLTVKNLTFADGYTSEQGGAILTEHQAQLSVENVNFTGNVADEGGGAIYSGWETDLTVVGSTFDGNEAIAGNNERGAGAIAFVSPGEFTVKNSEFTNNRGINGGAINSLNGKLTIEDSKFINNDTAAASYDAGGENASLRGYGGAVYTDRASSTNEASGTIRISNTEFEGNTAANGGAAYLYTAPQDKVIVENSSFENNEALGLQGGEGGSGGALLSMTNGLNQGLTISNTSFTNNTAAGSGGGLWMMGAPTKIIGSTFSGNEAQATDYSGNGGAMNLYGPTEIVGSQIVGNNAGWVGGGVAADGSQVTVKDTIFANNTADNGSNGWGIQQHTSSELTDLGGNSQWPPKQTTNGNDYNATASIKLDPSIADYQVAENTTNTGASGSTPVATDGSGSGMTPVDVADSGSNNGTPIEGSGTDSGSIPIEGSGSDSGSTPIEGSGTDSGSTPIDPVSNGSNNGAPVDPVSNGSNNGAPVDPVSNGSNNGAPVDPISNGSNSGTPVDTTGGDVSPSSQGGNPMPFGNFGERFNNRFDGDRLLSSGNGKYPLMQRFADTFSANHPQLAARLANALDNSLSNNANLPDSQGSVSSDGGSGVTSIDPAIDNSSSSTSSVTASDDLLYGGMSPSTQPIGGVSTDVFMPAPDPTAQSSTSVSVGQDMGWLASVSLGQSSTSQQYSTTSMMNDKQLQLAAAWQGVQPSALVNQPHCGHANV